MRIALVEQVGCANGYTDFIKQEIVAAMKERYGVAPVSTKGLGFKKQDSRENILIIIQRKKQGSWLTGLWYDILLPKFLLKNNIDALADLTGNFSRKKVTRQITVLPGMDFLNKSKKHEATRSTERMKEAFAKTQKFIVYSEDVRVQVSKSFDIPPEAIEVVSAITKGAAEPASWEEREKIKEAYSTGNEYFFVEGLANVERVVQVLRAFSHFKRWQRSNMYLIICFKQSSLITESEEKLATYKYRASVKLLEDTRQADELLKAAYGYIFEAKNVDDFLPVYKAYGYKVPVITNLENGEANNLNEPTTKFSEDDFENLGKRFVNVYKDELQRSELIAEGIKKYEALYMENAREKLWEIVSVSIG